MLKKWPMWFVLDQLQEAPQLEAGAGEPLIPIIRPSGLKFLLLKVAVFHTGYIIRCETVLLGTDFCGTISKTNGGFC